MTTAVHPPGTAKPRWGAFALICLSYLVATTGEQMLSPLYPTASEDLGLSIAQGGLVFGLLSASIAGFNLVGGLLLRRMSPGWVIRISGIVGAVGSVGTATAHGLAQLIAAQMIVGAGAGLFFPSGLQAVPRLAGTSRKGFAMGIYGVAFSGGLTLAAIFGAIGSSHDWRLVFWIAAGLGVIAACTGGVDAHAKPVRGAHTKFRVVRLLALPTYVGSILAILQYGAIPFFTTFAVDVWGVLAASAATILIIGRVFSVVTKVIGGASADRVGARASARRTGAALTVTGLAWILMPPGLWTYGLAAAFVGLVSTLGPVANVLAVEAFGGDGMALGAYRSAQIGIGAAASALIGLAGEHFGLRPTLTVIAFTPLALIAMCWEPREVRHAARWRRRSRPVSAVAAVDEPPVSPG